MSGSVVHLLWTEAVKSPGVIFRLSLLLKEPRRVLIPGGAAA